MRGFLFFTIQYKYIQLSNYQLAKGTLAVNGFSLNVIVVMLVKLYAFLAGRRQPAYCSHPWSYKLRSSKRSS